MQHTIYTVYERFSLLWISSLKLLFLSWHLFLKYQWMAFMIQLDNNTIKQLWDEPDQWKRIRLFPPTNPWIASPFKHQSACALMFFDIAYCKATHSQSQLCQGALPVPCRKFKTNPVVICSCQRNGDGFLKAFFLHGCLATPTDCRLRFSCSLVLCEWPVAFSPDLIWGFFWSAIK